MQKRRSTVVPTLPITASDSLPNTSDQKWNKVAHRKHDDYLSGRSLAILVSAFILLFIYTATSDKTSHVKSKMQERLNIAAYQKYFKPDYEVRPTPLSKFKSLEYALAHSELIGLYFAASWCRMSTPVSNSLEEIFPPGAAGGIDDRILSPQSTVATRSAERKALAIVYVSSDESEEDMIDYSRKNWINVPYGSTERTSLKQHFQVCAKPEVEQLDITRNFEIPTLIIIDSVSHGILTTSGHIDLEQDGAVALDHWLELRDTVRGLENKYED